MDMVDDCLYEEINRGTEDCFDAGENNPVKEDGGEEVDIILFRRSSIPCNQG